MKENRSVSRVLAILEVISKNPEGLTLGQVYRMLDIPKATAYDMLQTLYKTDAVYYKDPHLRNYVIGSKMYAIGSVYTKNSSLIEAARPLLIEFSDKTGYTTFVTKRVNGKIIYVDKYEPLNRKIVTQPEIGTTTYDFKDTFIGQSYQMFDDNILCNETKISKCAGQQGYLWKLTGETHHIQNYAVPIMNFENRVCGIIVASDLAIGEVEAQDISQELVEIGQKISKKLGFLGGLNE